MTIKADIDILKYKVDEIHKELMGNGRPGLVKEWQEQKGAVKAFKWVAGSGLGISLITLLKTIIGG